MSQTIQEKDLQQIESMGLTPSAIEKQMDNFRNGFPKSQLVEAATVANGGIQRLSDAEINRYTTAYKTLGAQKKIMKFVPASGAASRMFKDLYTFSSTYFGVAKNFEKEFPSVKEFLQHIRTFAFFEDLQSCMERSSLDFGDYMDRGDFTTVINYLLKDQYLGYGSLPKALLKFHRYGGISRTAFEEHIVEGAFYAKNSDGSVNLHFTVSPEHRQLFRKKVSEVKRYYESELGIKLHITFSEQKHYTDTIAVDEYNTPLRDDEGKLVFRPAGHGALIENLNECRADIIFIKNIDNVVPDWMKHTTIVYKQVLGGILLELQKQVFDSLHILDKKASAADLRKIARFATEKLHLTTSEGFDKKTAQEKAEELRSLLNRPLRVCGMVKNQGEPGGGPFFTLNSHGIKSLQIVETAQINRKDPQQESILASATHFNPVDLVCGIRDYRGRYFDLRKYVDPTTGFIAKKSKGSQTVKSQELPGLWNGAMAEWVTVFVEVPLASFNPVKSVNDLLRKEHLEG